MDKRHWNHKILIIGVITHFVLKGYGFYLLILVAMRDDYTLLIPSMIVFWLAPVATAHLFGKLFIQIPGKDLEHD